MTANWMISFTYASMATLSSSLIGRSRGEKCVGDKEVSGGGEDGGGGGGGVGEAAMGDVPSLVLTSGEDAGKTNWSTREDHP